MVYLEEAPADSSSSMVSAQVLSAAPGGQQRYCSINTPVTSPDSN